LVIEFSSLHWIEAAALFDTTTPALCRALKSFSISSGLEIKTSYENEVLFSNSSHITSA